MAMVQIRDLPEHIYDALVQRARAERRSLSQQAVVTLARGLDLDVDFRERRREVLRRIKQRDNSVYANLPDPVKLIREDRER